MLFFLFLIIDLYFLIFATVAKTFVPIVELIIHIEISIKEEKAEMEIHIVTAKTKVRKCSMGFRVIQTFSFLLLNNSFWSIPLIK